MKDSGFDSDRLREAMGFMTSADLAAKLGCPKSNISMYLSGKREPSKMAVQLMSLILGVNPAWLCGLDVPKYSNAKVVSNGEFSTLSEDELQIIEIYRQLDEEGQNILWDNLRTVLKYHGKKNNAISGDVAL